MLALFQFLLLRFFIAFRFVIAIYSRLYRRLYRRLYHRLSVWLTIQVREIETEAFLDRVRTSRSAVFSEAAELKRERLRALEADTSFAESQTWMR